MKKNKVQQYDFFISRTGADAEWAKWIYNCLSKAGYSLIMQDFDFRPGQDFIFEMDRAMRNAKRTIIVLSRSFDKALFTVPEWTNAIAKDPTGHQSLLVPVKVDDIIPEGIFKTRVFIDLYGIDEEKAKQKLLDGVKRTTVKKSGQPDFPGKITSRFEGSLPPVWRIPYERNPVFTGRDKELQEINKVFSSSQSPPFIASLTGLGGIGKTALAVEYAHRMRDFLKVAWWVRAESRETIFADMALLAEALKLDSTDETIEDSASDETIEDSASDETIEDSARKAIQWLNNHDSWLLIMDAAETPALIQGIIPSGGNGQIIITSRNPGWRRIASVIPIEPLSEEVAVSLLHKRSGVLTNGVSAELVNLVGRLPLAIELAGAFLEQQGLTVGEYLNRIKKRDGIPMDDKNYRPPDYEEALNSVWVESFRVLQEQSPVAMILLRLAAFFSPHDIPRPILTKGAQYLPGDLCKLAMDPDSLADLVARPRAYSLISTYEDGFSINRLVQAMIRNSLSRQEQESFASDAIGLLEYVLPKKVSDFRLWNKVGRIISHVHTAATYGVKYTVEKLATVKLLDRSATYMQETGAGDQEIDDLRRSAMELAETIPGGPPVWLINNQGVWLIKIKKPGEAEQLIRKAIDKIRMEEGGDAESLGVFWTNLGNLKKTMGQPDEAILYLTRGLTILDSLPAMAGLHRAIAHGLLGELLFEKGDKKAAEVHFYISSKEYDNSIGPGSLEAITARSYLAQARGEDPNIVVSYTVTPASISAEEGRLLAMDDAWHKDAEKSLRSAMEQGEPGAAVELASLLRSQEGREEEGVQVLVNAVNKGDKDALYWLARELAEKNGIAAEELVTRSIAAGNVFSNYDLGLILYNQPGREAEAEQAYRRALDGGFTIALNDLGILLLEWPGREGEGEAILSEAGRYGQTRCWFNLASYLSGIPGREAEAQEMYLRAGNAGYLKAFGVLAYSLEKQNKLAEALSVFKKGVEAGDKNLVPHLNDFMVRHPGINTE